MTHVFTRALLVVSVLFSLGLSTCRNGDNENGRSAIATSQPEPAGVNCRNGGTKITTGQDLNGNGKLDSGEPVQTTYACNGSDGQQLFVDIETEVPGQNCEKGGHVIRVGIDLNRNNRWDPATETPLSLSYACDGVDGASTLVVLSIEPRGTHCANGGLLVQAGTDRNRSGQLETGEFETSYVCNGVNSLIKQTVIPYGSQECPAGGLRIDSGLDLDGSGELDPNEVTATSTLCATLTCTRARFSVRPEYVCPADAFPLVTNMPSYTRGLVSMAYGKILVSRSTGSSATEAVDNLTLVDNDGDLTNPFWTSPYGGISIAPRDGMVEIFGYVFLATNTDLGATGKMGFLAPPPSGVGAWTWTETYSAPNASANSRILSYEEINGESYFSTGLDQPSLRKVTGSNTSEVIAPGIVALQLEADEVSRNGAAPRLYFIDYARPATIQYFELPLVSGVTPLAHDLYTLPSSLAHFPGYEPRASGLAVDEQGRVYVGCGSAPPGSNLYNSSCTRGLVRVNHDGTGAVELIQDQRVVRGISYRADSKQLHLLMEYGATGNGYQLERVDVVH